MTTFEPGVFGGLELGGSAATSFEHGTANVDADVVVEWDFDNDDDFSESVEDVTSYVLNVETITGRDFPSQLTGKATAGRLRATLDNRDGRFSYFNQNSPLNQDGNSLKVGRKIRLRTAEAGLHALATGSNGSASTPDHADFAFSGDHDVRAHLSLDDWTPSAVSIVVAQSAFIGDIGFAFAVNTDGTLSLSWSTNGSTGTNVARNSTVATGFANGSFHWIRATVDVDNGAAGHDVRFFTSEDGVNWTQLGATVTNAGVTSVFNSTQPLTVSNSLVSMAGQVRYVEVRNGIDGTIVANPDFTVQPVGTTSFTDSTGKTWTVNSPASVVADQPPSDPLLLVRDRFNRPDGTLGETETGQTWTFPGAGGLVTYRVEDNRVVANQADLHLAAVETGSEDHYVQATIENVAAVLNNFIGLTARFTDVNNYVYVRVQTNSVQLIEVVSGTPTTLGTYFIDWWPGMTVGLRNGPGDEVAAYVGGVEVLSDTTSLAAASEAGLVYDWELSFGFIPAPAIDNFHVWDGTVTETEGILWTGDVSDIKPSTSVDGFPTVEVTAEGFLARAALPDVLSPRAVDGAATGVLVGDVLQKAGLLHPPATIQEGVTVTGPVALNDGNALELARKFEETEVGFLHETNEGPLAYDDRTARGGADVVAIFSDAPGAQFGYVDIEPYDQRREIVNRVTAGVAAEAPSGITTTADSNNTAAGVANNVTVDIPALDAGDVCIVFIASTVGTASVEWLNPIWWQNHRDQLKGDIRTRVYSHATGVAEAATTVTFYIDSTPSGGAWVAHIYKIGGWYEATQGLAISEFVNGSDPPPFEHGFGRVPTLFIAVNAGLTSVNGARFADTEALRYPDGYLPRENGVFLNGTVNGFDVGLSTADRLDVAEGDDPTAFTIFEGFAINESAVFAVRGFNGEHGPLATIQGGKLVGVPFEESPGRFVTVDDVAAQDEQRVIRSHVNASNLFANEADAEAYADTILATYSDDRPIVSMTFVANKTSAYRNQAIRRRVGDKIHLVAENDTVLGINADFFIESINHRITNGGKLWEITWELSPA